MMTRKQLIALLAAILINGDVHLSPKDAVKIAKEIIEATR
jgi:hypothetical protein